MKDIFEKVVNRMGPLGQYAKEAHGYFAFPKLEGPIAPRMKFNGKTKLTWSLNNYLGLAAHPEVIKADADAAAEFGMAYPMGARMMSGNSVYHEQLERDLADFIQKPDVILLNYGYQGVVSAIDALVDRHDVIVYDAESHACIIDGVRLHMGKRFMYQHNNMESLEKQLTAATKLAAKTGGGIMVITEGVFGMSGSQGKIKEVVDLKKKFNFRLFVDDAHGFGTMGKTGYGTGEEQNCQDGIDIYFSTFAKSMAGIGAFIGSTPDIIRFLRYNMRSQIYAKTLPMPMTIGSIKRLELIRSRPELKENLWKVVNALQGGLKAAGFNIGVTTTPVTPVLLQGEVNEASHLIVDLRENYNIFCSIVIYPVVPKGVIMLRLIPTAVHTIDDVNETLGSFQGDQEQTRRRRIQQAVEPPANGHAVREKMKEEGRGWFTMLRGEYSGAFFVLIAGIILSLLPRIFYSYKAPGKLIFRGDTSRVAAFEKAWHERRGNRFSKEYKKRLSIFKASESELVQAGLPLPSVRQLLALGKEKFRIHSFTQLAQKVGCDSTLLAKALWPWWDRGWDDPFEDNFEPRKENNSKEKYSKTIIPVLINSCDTNDLIDLPGIGPATARRIVNYRDKLGGFLNFQQMKETWNIDTIKLNSMREYFQIDISAIRKININSVTETELDAHPYISARQASSIIKFRKQHGKINSKNYWDMVVLKNSDKEKILPYLEF